jgi:hypothetical protein
MIGLCPQTIPPLLLGPIGDQGVHDIMPGLKHGLMVHYGASCC